jgi:hypothetical protein
MRMPINSSQHLLRFYLSTCVVFVIFVVFEVLYVSKVSFVEDEISALSPLQEKQLEVVLEMNHLLTTLATASLGAMGAFLIYRYKPTDRLPGHQLWRANGSCALAGLSLFCGYLSYDKLVWMLGNQFFNPSNPRILWLNRIQFWAFALSVFFAADFVFRALGKNED